MSLIDTDGIILRTYGLSDADRIAMILTRDHGVIRGVAKGAKRLQSKFGSALEPLSEVHVTYFQKESAELVSIQSLELINSRFDLASDPSVFHHFAHISTSIGQLSPPNDPNELLYRMTRASLDAIGKDHSMVDSIRVYFDVWLLRLAGYFPDWSKCAMCGREFNDDEHAMTDGYQRLIGGCCARQGNERNQISPSVREIVSNVRVKNPVEFSEAFSTRTTDIDKLVVILDRLMAIATGNEVKGSSYFIHSVRMS